MDSMLVGAVSAFWFGILTSISPCPLATNIAAISYIGKHMDSHRKIVLSGLFYTAGRVMAYIGVSFMIIYGLLSIPQVSFFLQEYLNMLLGPILMVAGILLLELFPVSIPDLLPKKKLGYLVENGNIMGAGLLGIIFALSFCPISAALFFGSLIPVAVKHDSVFLFPSLFGIGTGLPVFIVAFMIGFSFRNIGKALNIISRFEYWARKITGVIFILVGGFYSCVYLFGITF